MEMRAPRRRWWGKIPASPEERRFLAGPENRLLELLRALRIFAEFIRGFRALSFIGPCVTVFGSARFPESHRYYQMAREVGAGQLSEIEVVDAPPVRRSVDAIRRKDAGSPGGVVHAFLQELEATLRIRERRSVQLVV